MLNMDIKTVAMLTGGTICHGDMEKYGNNKVSSICYDSRKADAGSIFVPIVGEKVDAHRFIPQVFDTGCCVSFTKSSDVINEYATDKILIKVDDTVKAAQKLACEYRKSIQVPVVGITGSVGKTTTREMIMLALSAGKKVYGTKGNKNSQIGTPETLFGFDEDADICVFEMGMNMPGEMTRLAEMVRPDTAVFTNIGVTHIEYLGSREAILKEKLHITDFMPEGAVVFVNNDNDMLKDIKLKDGLVKCTYGLTNESDVYARDIDLTGDYPKFTAVVHGKDVKVSLNTYGKFQIYNALAGLAVADHYGIDLNESAKKLNEYAGYEHRNRILRNDFITVIDDTYNAAPDSMKAALDMLSTIRCTGRRIAVLADMKELGDISRDAHFDVGRCAADKGNIDILITYGPLASDIERGFASSGTTKSMVHTEDGAQLSQMLETVIKPGDLVLFKGSNSMGLFGYIDKVLNYEFM